jgi:hypothetical protein
MPAIDTASISDQLGHTAGCILSRHPLHTSQDHHRQTVRRARPSDLPPVVSLVHAARLAALAGNVIAVAAYRSAVLAGWGR